MQYADLVKVYESLESTSKRLEKTNILSQLFRKVKDAELKEIVYLSQGTVFPSYDAREIGISSQIVMKIIATATGISLEEVERHWKTIGDLGKVAEILVQKKKQSTLFSSSLTILKVFYNIRKIADISGSGSIDRKISLVAELLTAATPAEAKYIIRTVLEELRIGVGEGIVRDAILQAFFADEIGLRYTAEDNILFIKDEEAYKLYTNAVQEAYDISNDFGVVITAAKKGLKSLESIQLMPGRAMKVMLALKAKNFQDAFKTVGKPCAVEFKYDGFRLMINKSENGEIRLFTRRLEDVTKQFPEVTAYVGQFVKGSSFILDSEAVGYDPAKKRYMPFQQISQRIRRKYGIEKLERELPVEVNVFDVLYYEGKNFLKKPFRERRALLEKAVKGEKWKLMLSRQIITSSEKEAEKFYKQALKEGEEGVMFKNLDSPYKPGSRAGHMLKMKPASNTFDLVIVGAEHGTGKRSRWLSSYILACQSEGKLLEIGRVSTGLKEKEEEGVSFHEITSLLQPLILSEQGRIVSVRPEIVVEVTYQEIQKSPTYSSGYALRFPRFTRLRPDRSTKDIAFLKEIEQEYLMQSPQKK